MNEPALNLPPLYEPVPLDGPEHAKDAARRLAQEGAPEGTLVWGATAEANLDCALVLRPDYPFEEAMQLGLVAAVSLGVTLAGLVSPMTALRYRWPGEVLLNDSRVANIDLQGPPGRELDWLVLGVNVNVTSHPTEPAFAHTSLAAVADDEASITAISVLESFGRQFLSWTSRWADAGFEPVRKAWLQRADGVGETIEVLLPARAVNGIFEDLDTQGDLILKIAQGEHLSLAVAEYFCLDRSA